ncbi:hypothetical protein [Parasphingorhabdus sp.]|uniref:hypothetical protein n=1 Tax=Parasphingorhabdus sp. TaxID=2709688 RepID=UPI003264D079
MRKYLLALMTGAVASSASITAAQTSTELTAPDITAAAQSTVVQPESSSENDAVTPAASDLLSSVLSPEELNRMSSGNQIAINTQSLIAENTGNTINGDYTAGDVSFDGDAFSGFSGLGNIVVNTGAQSSLQAGMSITINISE